MFHKTFKLVFYWTVENDKLELYLDLYCRFLKVLF